MKRRAMLVVLSAVVVVATLTASPADARRRRREVPFEPSEATLACIRGPWAGKSMESGGNYAEPGSGWDATDRTYYGYGTAYQMDDDFARAYSAPIPDEHWALWGSSRTDAPWTWHPMIQDEVARNGVRARGLGPWSARVKAMCPRG